MHKISLHANMEFTVTNMRMYTFYSRTISKLHIDIHTLACTRANMSGAREIYTMYACSRIPFSFIFVDLGFMHGVSVCACVCIRVNDMCVSRKHLYPIVCAIVVVCGAAGWKISPKGK